jgi:glutamate synthase (NADPH/NADH) small chain
MRRSFDEHGQLQRRFPAGTTFSATSTPASRWKARRSQLEALEQSEAVETFHNQMALLQRRLLADPQAFRDMFIADGTNAIVWEFKQPELGADFIKTFWNLLLRDDDTSKVLMRFVWNVPLGLKRKFVRAIDQHLSDRYPMFKGLSEGWPAESFIPPYIRSPEERSKDFGWSTRATSAT